MPKINPHRLVPAALLAVAALAVTFPLIEEREMARTESVELEKLTCVSAICLEDAATGRACREVPKQLGVTRLIKSFDNLRLVVELTGTHCP